jgi:hypothetical protein
MISDRCRALSLFDFHSYQRGGFEVEQTAVPVTLLKRLDGNEPIFILFPSQAERVSSSDDCDAVPDPRRARGPITNKDMESITTYSLDVFAMSRVSRSFRRALCVKAHWNDRLPELKGLMEKSPEEIASLLTWIEVDGWVKALRENPYPKSILMSFSSRKGCLRLGEVLGPHGVSILAIVASARTSVRVDADQHWDATIVVPFVTLVETIKVCVEFGAEGTMTAW